MLLASFLSRLMNRRRDRYGHDREGRTAATVRPYIGANVCINGLLDHKPPSCMRSRMSGALAWRSRRAGARDARRLSWGPVRPGSRRHGASPSAGGT